jgi:Leucine-rich repeat (LRR) protein
MDNNIYELPIEICNLHNLRNLSVSINRLTELPIEFRELISLNYFDLESSGFEDVPDYIQSSFNFCDNKIAKSHKRHWDNSIKQQKGRVQWV